MNIATEVSQSALLVFAASLIASPVAQADAVCAECSQQSDLARPSLAAGRAARLS